MTRNIQGQMQLTEDDKKWTWEAYIRQIFAAERDNDVDSMMYNSFSQSER